MIAVRMGLKLSQLVDLVSDKLMELANLEREQFVNQEF